MDLRSIAQAGAVGTDAFFLSENGSTSFGTSQGNNGVQNHTQEIIGVLESPDNCKNRPGLREIFEKAKQLPDGHVEDGIMNDLTETIFTEEPGVMEKILSAANKIIDNSLEALTGAFQAVDNNLHLMKE